VAGLPLVGFDSDILQEVLVRLYVAGYRAVEIPIHFQPRAEGSSKARLLRFAWSYLKTLFRLWRVRNAADAADYDDRAFSSLLLPKRWWQRQRYRTVLAFASGATGPALDAGCGSSRILAALPHAVGLDRAVPQLRFRTITNTRLAAGDCRRLPFADDVFGLAIASQLVEHNEDADACLDELARVLRPGGVLIVGTPDYGRARWRIAEALHRALVPAAAADRHVNRFTRQGLFVALERRGFTVERHAYVFGAELIVRVRKGGADR
jgi:SAM-dependent methyltransferase